MNFDAIALEVSDNYHLPHCDATQLSEVKAKLLKNWPHGRTKMCGYYGYLVLYSQIFASRSPLLVLLYRQMPKELLQISSLFPLQKPQTSATIIRLFVDILCRCDRWYWYDIR